ncbi:MAG: NUDIX hydrolase [Parcubacteria group bacterium]
MPAGKISLDNAKKDKLFYFVANVLVFRENDERCLILKRDMREKVHPGRWGTPGGKLEWKDIDIEHPTRLNGDVIDFQDAVENLLRREAREEAGIEIGDDFRYVNSNVFVRPDETPVVLIKLAAKYKGGNIVPEVGGFTDYAWVNEDEVKNYECIDGVPEEVAKTIKIFKR